mmetsp:Transcript_10366/g.9160  ORF Transcript_10366/g.9160 Transcript_10366/m.9160 type:complete len:114 (-) Transcript_10366:21-362(-)
MESNLAKFQQTRDKETRLYIVYRSLFQKLKEELSQSFECPLSLDTISSPAILPSGHTIEESFMVALINKRKLDPFNNTNRCRKIVINRFCIQVREILENITKMEQKEISTETG